MDSLLHWISRQPDAARAAVAAAGIAAAFALLGVIINNLVSAWLAARQLRHSVQLAEKERSFKLRQEIYLGVAVALQANFNGIIRMADLGLAYADVAKEMLMSREFLGKVHVVAPPKLVTAINLAQHRITESLIKVRLERRPLEDVQFSMQRARRELEKHQLSQDESIAWMKSRSLEGMMHDAEWKRLENAVDLAQKFAAKAASEHDEHRSSLAEGGTRLFLLAQRESLLAASALFPVIKLIREELGETFDETAYQALLSREPLPEAQVRALFGAPQVSG